MFKTQTYSPGILRGLALAACLLMSFSALVFAENQFVHVFRGVFLALLGGAVLILALTHSDSEAQTDSTAQELLQQTNWMLLIPGIIFLMLLAEINGGWLGWYLPPHVQFGLLVGGIALVVMGLGGVNRAAGWRVNVDRQEILIVGAITLLALVVRLWRLGDAFRVFIDEVGLALANNTIRSDPNINLLQPYSSITAFPWLYPYWQAEAIHVFGRNLTGLRFVSAIIGTMGIPALYLLAKQLFDRQTAVLAALILASLPVHVHYSRLSYNNIADPLFGTLAFAFLVRGVRTHLRLDFALAGAFLGLTQYFYEGGRLLYPVLALTAIVGILYWLPDRRRGLMVMILAAMITAAPIYYTLLGIDAPLVRRLDLTKLDLSAEFWQILADGGQLEVGLWHHAEDGFLVYVHRSEMNLFYRPYLDGFLFYRTPATFYYGGNQPLVPRPLVPVFLLGIFVAVWRWRVGGGMLILCLVLASLGNFLIQVNAVTARYVVTFPVLALLMALGIRYTLSLIWNQVLLLGVIGIGITLGQTVFYFDVQLDYLNRTIHDIEYLHIDPDDALQRAVDFPDGTQVHLVTDVPLSKFNVADVGRFLHPGLVIDIVKPEAFTSAYLEGLPRDVDHAFFLEPDDKTSLVLLQPHFALQPPQTTPYNTPPERAFILYYAPAN